MPLSFCKPDLFGYISEKAHRTVIAFVGVILMIIAGTCFGCYRPEQAFEAIDFNTIGLLLGMMVIVSVLEDTGYLEYLAIISAKVTKGNPWLLVVILGTVTTLVSLIIDNVTTVIIVAPVTIVIAKILGISARPMLMAEALLSDTGGVATLVGDPPNVMIGSAAHFTFVDFLTHLAPIVLIAWLATLLTLRLIFRRELSKKPDHIESLVGWEAAKSIKNKGNAKKVLWVLVLVVILFLVHHRLHIEPSFVAMIGAALVLFLVSLKSDPQEIFSRVEWSVLGFFIALFVMVGGLISTGVMDQITGMIFSYASDNTVKTALIILWVSAVVSALIDNIPFTIAMIPIIQQMQSHGIPDTLIWWALALGAGFGGNGSPVGSTANVVVVSRSEETKDPITFANWFKSGTAATVVTCAIASLSILLFHSWLEHL